MQPTVAIVILNWNGRKYLEQFLPAVLASTYSNKQVIVADNASTDDSVSWIRAHHPSVGLILLPENFGFAGGYNQALKQVQADYYILLNSDVETPPDWIEPLVALMESDARIGACQPKLLSYAHRDKFEYAGAAGGWIDFLGYPFARGRVFDHCERDQGQYDQAEAIFWASGAALCVRSRLFHELGGFDTYFFAHQEEIDFCWRMQLAGWLVFACPQSRVFHVGGGTLPKGNERKVFLNFRNNLIMLAKNLPFGKALGTIGFRILLDILSASKSLLAGQFVYFAAVLEAHLAFGKWVLFKRHKSVFPRSRKNRLQGWFGHSVVWAHFVQGKKTFSEIVQVKP